MEELHRISVQEFKEAEKLPLTVVLDNVRSQNNIGSVFRTGDAFRVERICLCGICSTPPHRDIHKTALGAEESVDWKYYEESVDCVRELKEQGYKVYAIEQVDDSMKLDALPEQGGHYLWQRGGGSSGGVAALVRRQYRDSPAGYQAFVECQLCRRHRAVGVFQDVASVISLC